MSNKISKEDLKSPDQVTKTLRQGFVWTTGHSNIVLGALAVFVVLGVGISLAGHFSSQKEISQQEKYFILEKSYTETKRNFEEGARSELMAAQAAKDKTQAPAPQGKKASGDIQADYGTVISGFEAFIADDHKTIAARMAALNLSDIYLSYKKNDEALASLQKVEAGLSSSDMVTALIWMQMGNILANKNDCASAVAKWQSLVGSKALSFAHDETKVRMGLCYEAMNDTVKAEQMYSEVGQKAADNATLDVAASREASKYLRALKAKKNL